MHPDAVVMQRWGVHDTLAVDVASLREGQL